MNKILLISLMVLLGVLAFALGLFSKDSSTELSQYVPNSVGEMFSKTKNKQSTRLNTQQKDKTVIKTLTMPDTVSSNNLQQTVLAKNLAITLDAKKTSENTLFEISDNLMAEIEKDLFLRTSQANLASFKHKVTQVDSANQALNTKLITLKEESQALDVVLEKLDNKLKDTLRANKVLPKKRDKLLKELEKQIQNLNH